MSAEPQPHGSRPSAIARLHELPGWALVGAGVAVILLALALLGEVFGGGPGGPTSSSYATGSQGLAGWAELLRRSGHPVSQLRTPLTRARLAPGDTVVVLDPEALVLDEGQRLLAFVRAGGRLVIGGSDAQGTLPAVLRSPPAWTPAGPPRALPGAVGSPTIEGVAEVRSAGEGAWGGTAGYSRLLGGVDGGALLLEQRVGGGTLELLADASPLQNRLLAGADNARLGLGLAGPPPRAVVFAESVHGFGQSRGLAALPSRWRLAFAGLVLAGLVWILARGRRLGPAEPAEASTPPPRGAYIEALARLLRRSSPEELSTTLARLRDRP